VQQCWLQADDTISQPQTPTADTPIQASAAIINVPSEEAVSTPKQGKTDSPNRNRPVVRGIATQLSNTLVLVTAQNEILDVLTPTAAKITRADWGNRTTGVTSGWLIHWT